MLTDSSRHELHPGDLEPRCLLHTVWQLSDSAFLLYVFLRISTFPKLCVWNSTLCRVRGSELRFLFWVSWFPAKHSSSVNTRLCMKLEASPGEAGRLARGPLKGHFLGEFTWVWGQIPGGVCSETRFSWYIKKVLGMASCPPAGEAGADPGSPVSVCKRNPTLHCGWVTAGRRDLHGETMTSLRETQVFNNWLSTEFRAGSVWVLGVQRCGPSRSGSLRSRRAPVLAPSPEVWVSHAWEQPAYGVLLSLHRALHTHPKNEGAPQWPFVGVT